MTERQLAFLKYHQDVASFGTSSKAPVFVILDLEDESGFEIAQHYLPNCANNRDSIKASGAYPAYTLAMPVDAANGLIAHGWPGMKPMAVACAGFSSGL